MKIFIVMSSTYMNFHLNNNNNCGHMLMLKSTKGLKFIFAITRIYDMKFY